MAFRWTLPQALQKCTARMVPQDQQVEVASPGMMRLDLDSGFAINKFTTEAHRLRRPVPGAAHGGAVVIKHQVKGGGQECPPHTRSTRERGSTAARLRRIRIHEDEALLH